MNSTVHGVGYRFEALEVVKGGEFAWARLPHGRRDSMAFALELMEKSGVIVTPGASFGPSGEGFVRMALVLPPERIREAVAAIAAACL